MNVSSLREQGGELIENDREKNAEQLNIVRALFLKTERKGAKKVLYQMSSL